MTTKNTFLLMFRSFFLLLIFSISYSLTAQIKQKEIRATRINTTPKIDGVLDDEVWKNLPVYGDFLMLQPNNNGEKERITHKTEVKMAYDNKAVYFAVYLYDDDPDKILKQFSQRDQIFVQADWFSININTLNDKINETNFYVTSAGTIGDSRGESGNEDFQFDVVFQSNISYDEKGWYAEFKIPYNALRFPEVAVQDWSINFFRQIRHLNETYSWNYVDRQVGDRTLYSGLVTGLSDIDAPLRLILFPFAQGTISTFDGDTESDFNAGLDLKYGLTDNFTLDATLIPDFGQAAFDAVELNLGPFEQVFDENRQFFIEGTDLFDTNGLFFSRRIGSAPTRSGDVSEQLEANEEIVENPDNVDVINAIKISGRTKNKLGISFLNAITAQTEAVIRDSITGETREVVTESFSNYNAIALDQQFGQNSSITLINTNVTRSGDFRDANVTALLTDLVNKKNSYNASGGVLVSRVRENGNTTSGLRTRFDLRKIQGNFRWRLSHFLADDNYDSNDLGLQFRNNFNNFIGEVSYEIFEPTKKFNRYRIALRHRHRRLFTPSVLTENRTSINSFFFTPKRFAFGVDLEYSGDRDDYFEPRIDGRFVTFSSNAGGGFFISTDFRKKFALDLRANYRRFFEDPEENLTVFFSPRYRFSDKFLVILSSEFSERNDDFGFIAEDGVDVFLGQRDVTSIENSVQASYNFDPYKAINLRFRNFWSTADYSDDIFFILNQDGTRSSFDFDTTADDPNTNFNIWNLDLSFNWRFAPGSQATFLYRNSIFNESTDSQLNYANSLSNLFDQPVRHTVSLRVVYFLDVNNLKSSSKS